MFRRIRTTVGIRKVRESPCGCNSHGSFLTAKGREAAAQRELEMFDLDGMASERYLDRVGSVSASNGDGDVFVDELLDEQYRRFLNGS